MLLRLVEDEPRGGAALTKRRGQIASKLVATGEELIEMGETIDPEEEDDLV